MKRSYPRDEYPTRVNLTDDFERQLFDDEALEWVAYSRRHPAWVELIVAVAWFDASKARAGRGQSSRIDIDRAAAEYRDASIAMLDVATAWYAALQEKRKMEAFERLAEPSLP